MTLKNSLFIKKIFLSAFLLFLPACYFNTRGANTAFNLPSVGANFAPSDSELFYVDLDVDAYESAGALIPYYEISTTEEYGDSISRESPSNCEIEYIPSEDGAKDATETLICILDVPEWEFIVKDFHIVYNFPEGEMCDFTRISLPWHFNYPITAGPVSMECGLPGGGGSDDGGDADDGDDSGDSGDDSGDDSGTGYCDDRTGSFAECGDRCVEEESYLCDGDPKCCFGGKKTDGSAWEPEDECFGGPAVVAEGLDVEDFFKRIVNPLPESGLRQTITLKHLISVNGAESFDGASSSAPYANYISNLDIAGADLENVSRSSLPDFLQNSNFNKAPRLFFEFSCLDSAGEVLHSIFLMIREWNTFEEFYNFYDSGGVDEGDPNVEGKEGSDCEYESVSSLDGEFEQCNDLMDLEDVDSCSANLYPSWCEQFNQRGGNYPRIRYSLEEESGSEGSGDE